LHFLPEYKDEKVAGGNATKDISKIPLA